MFREFCQVIEVWKTGGMKKGRPKARFQIKWTGYPRFLRGLVCWVVIFRLSLLTAYPVQDRTVLGIGVRTIFSLDLCGAGEGISAGGRNQTVPSPTGKVIRNGFLKTHHGIVCLLFRHPSVELIQNPSSISTSRSFWKSIFKNVFRPAMDPDTLMGMLNDLQVVNNVGARLLALLSQP